MKLSVVLFNSFPLLALGRSLEKRAVYAAGGYGLALSTCPASDPSQCDGDGSASDTCCPNGFSVVTPSGQNCKGYLAGWVCCPNGMYSTPCHERDLKLESDTQCSDAFEAEPYCADSSWVLWNVTAGSAIENGAAYFCCLQGQVGSNNIECLAGSTNLIATLAAAKVLTITHPSLLRLTRTSARAACAHWRRRSYHLRFRRCCHNWRVHGGSDHNWHGHDDNEQGRPWRGGFVACGQGHGKFGREQRAAHCV
jgi:hypothetical protein